MLSKTAAQRGRGTARSAFTADLGKLARAEEQVPLPAHRLDVYSHVPFCAHAVLGNYP